MRSAETPCWTTNSSSRGSERTSPPIGPPRGVRSHDRGASMSEAEIDCVLLACASVPMALPHCPELRRWSFDGPENKQRRASVLIGHQFFRGVMGNVSLRAIIFYHAAVLASSALLVGGALGTPNATPTIATFSDPALRLDRPTLSGVRAIRFLT